MEYITTEAIIFSEEDAYRVTAYIGEDGKIVTPNNTPVPDQSLVNIDAEWFRLEGGEQVPVSEGELPEYTKIKGDFLDQYRK